MIKLAIIGTSGRDNDDSDSEDNGFGRRPNGGVQCAQQ